MASSYNVYTAEYHGGARNHIGIWVATDEGGAGTGRIFHVIGSVVVGGAGMSYEDRARIDPLDAEDHVPGTKVQVGTVQHVDLERLRATCQKVPVPGPQLRLNGSRMDPALPLRRCTEWTREAVEALIAEGILLRQP